MKINLLCILCSISLFSFSQSYIWSINSKWIGSDFQLISSCTDDHGNTYLTGYFTDSIFSVQNQTVINSHPGTAEIFLVKISTNGILQWLKTFPGNKNEIPVKISCNADRIALLGTSDSTSLILNTDTLDSSQGKYFICMMNASGVPQWSGQISGNGSFIDVQDIAVNNQGRIVLSGNYGNGIDSIQVLNLVLIDLSPKFFEQTFCTVIDSAGSALWGRLIRGDAQILNAGCGIDKKNHVSLLINSGARHIRWPDGSKTYHCDSLAFPSSPGWYVGILTAFDESGNFIRAIRSDCSDPDPVQISRSLFVDETGNAFISGGFYNDTVIGFGGLITSIPLNNLFGNEFFLCIDTAGQPKWISATYGISAESVSGISNSSLAAFTGSVLQSGKLYTDGDSISFLAGDQYLILMDAQTGKNRWITSLPDSGFAESLSCGIDTTGHIYWSGNFTGDSLQTGPFALAKAPSAGTDWFLCKIDSSIVVSSDNEITTDRHTTIYPNPASTHLNIRSSCTQSIKGFIKDLNGNTIKTFSGKSIAIDELPAGMYLLLLTTDGRRECFKFIKQ